MFTVFMEHKLLSGIYPALLLLSILCQIVIGVIYRKMIKETDNMSATSHKFLKQCKLKFANCYQLNEGVANIPVFVDKFLAKASFMRITLTSLQHLSGQLMLLSVVAAGAGACREIMRGETVGKVLPFYIVSFLGLYVYFSISALVDLQGKRERLKTNLVDYLENHMVNKLRQSAIDWAEITGGRKGESGGDEVKKAHQADHPEDSRDIAAMREEIGLAARRREMKPAAERAAAGTDGGDKDMDEEKRAVFSRQEEQELEELLREFFV